MLGGDEIQSGNYGGHEKKTATLCGLPAMVAITGIGMLIVRFVLMDVSRADPVMMVR